MRDNFAAIGQAALVNATAKAQTVPNLTLVVSAFDYVSATGVRGSYAGGTSPALTGPTTNPRIALLGFTPATTTFAWTYGTEAASPVPPAYPFGVIPIVEVYCRVGLASITNTDTGTNGYILRLAPRVGPFGNPLTGVGDLIVGGTAGLPSRLAPVATGQVLISQGAGAAPIWSTDPVIRNLLVQGGAVGTNGVGVLALGPGTAPTTSPIDTVQLWTGDFTGEAGSRGLELRNERGGRLSWASFSSGGTYLRMYDVTGTVGADVLAGSSSAILSSIGNYPLVLAQNYTTHLTLNTDGSTTVSGEMVMTGIVRIQGGGPVAFLNKNASGQQALIAGQTNGLNRWQLVLGDTGAETGGNAGSNLTLYAFNDAGGLFGTPFSVIRSDGTNPIVIIAGGLMRAIQMGAPNSGGAGFRLLIASN
jgi:hypothetical protein